MKKQYQICQLC